MRRDRDEPRPEQPDTARRGSRIAQARGYHPRGRTVGEEPRAESARDSRGSDRPSLRLVPEADRTTDRTTRPERGNREYTGRRQPPVRERVSTRTGDTSRSYRTRLESGDVAGRGKRESGDVAGRGKRESGDVAGRGRRESGDVAGRAKEVAPVRTRRVSRRREVTVVPPELADQGRRLRISLSIVLVLLVVIAARLVQFQFMDAAAYAAQGLSDRLQPVDLPAPRGNIIDRDGAILAGSAEARYVFADPELITDPVKTADVLSPILGVPRSELVPRLIPHRYADGRVARFEYLARGVPVDTGTRISGLNLSGVGVRRDESRVVPGHDLAANLIGFVNREMTGLEGLEASYDDVLRGVDGKRTFEIGQDDSRVDLGQEIPGGYHEETPPRPGSTLQLTIDRDLQYEVQRILGARMSEKKATVGAAVVLDVRTGEVLAQASYPFYNAADPGSSKASDRVDNATGWVVEPGSVHKGIVFAACLQAGAIRPGDTVMVGPNVRKGDTRFTDDHTNWTPRPMTLPGILAYSSNVGTIALADKLGAQKLYDFQRAFGLGEMTGEHLPGESAGLVQPPKNWSDSSYGSVPIGHGVSVTPLQMAAVYAAIANGGVYVQPHLEKATVAPDGAVTPSKPPLTRTVISAENATALRNMLEAVVTVKGATGLSAAVANYRVAGKTGTGRMIANGKPVPGEVASFVGMAPADAPRYVIAVFAHTPAGNGGAVAGPAFSEMMAYTLRHFKVAPTGAPVPTFQVYG